jgi:hypothetical protein
MPEVKVSSTVVQGFSLGGHLKSPHEQHLVAAGCRDPGQLARSQPCAAPPWRTGSRAAGRDGTGCVMSGGTLTPMKRSSRLAAELGGEFRLGLDLLGHSV